MEESVKAKMEKDHYSMVSPSTWANGPKYAVFIASTTPRENSIYPSTASDAVDQVLSDLSGLFHF
jgi:enamine deaminase RidA (YjgF/YER057c/UK114 family)